SPNQSQVHHAYSPASPSRNTAIPPKMRHSVLIDSALPCPRSWPWSALGEPLRERLGGDRVRFLPDRQQRVGLAQPVLQRGDVGGVILWTDHAHLEIHHRVVDAAQLGAPAHVRALVALGDGDLEPGLEL